MVRLRLEERGMPFRGRFDNTRMSDASKQHRPFGLE